MSRLTPNIQYLIVLSLIMHTLLGITLILYLLKLSVGKERTSDQSFVRAVHMVNSDEHPLQKDMQLELVKF